MAQTVVQTRRSHGLAITLFALLMILHISPSARAVDTTVTNSLPNPGARSMGLGGAFAAQADDATAAFANPAGLVQLLRPEFMGEIRLWLYPDGETWYGGSDSELLDVSGVAFFSFVYPIDRWSFALYRNEVGRAELDQGVQLKRQETPSKLGTDFSWSVNSFEVVSYGLSAGYRLTEQLSLGLGASYYEGELSTEGNGTSTTNKESEWLLSTGILWHPSTTWSVGAFYRQGPDFGFTLPTSANTESTGSPYGFPDVLGAGVAWRSAGGALTLSGEWDLVRYSALSGEVGPLELQLEDAHEFHVAAEYAFLNHTPIWAIRVGAWRDPAHRTVVQGSFTTQQGEDEMHYATGFGFAFPRFQLDFAVDISDPVVTISTSGIFKF